MRRGSVEKAVEVWNKLRQGFTMLEMQYQRVMQVSQIIMPLQFIMRQKQMGGFYKAVSNRMGKMINGQYTKTSEGYFEGKGLGGNVNSKAFAAARASGMDALNSDPRFTNSIAAVIRSVTSSTDPTGGCRAWLGGTSAESYYNHSQKIYTNGKKEAVMQFSFTSNNKAFYHTFYHF